MGAYLTHRADLRTILCASLDKLLRQNKAYIEGVHDVTEAPASYTRAMAQANLTGVAQFAKNFLPIFFNLFVAAAAEHRGALHACVDAFAQQTDAASLGSFFRTIMRKYMKVRAEPSPLLPLSTRVVVTLTAAVE
jgi:ribosomal RNA-processing protein 12